MQKILMILVLFGFPLSASAAQVVTSIKPIHSLAASVMEGSGDAPLLLVDGKQSLHSFSLKPSQVQALNKAQIVFYISPHMELFLEKSLANAPNTTRVVALADEVGLAKYSVRLGGGFEAHQHEEEDHHEHEEEDHHEHEEDSVDDLHIWNSPANAKVMVAAMARELTIIDPTQKALYEVNAKKTITSIDALDAQLKTRLKPLTGKPFVVFHDASQYFERHYGLRAVGSLTLHPERGTSAAQIAAAQKKMKETGAVCAFREPQFDGKMVEQLLQGTNAKSGILDPEAALIEPSLALYNALLEGLAKGYEGCLL